MIHHYEFRGAPNVPGEIMVELRRRAGRYLQDQGFEPSFRDSSSLEIEFPDDWSEPEVSQMFERMMDFICGEDNYPGGIEDHL